MRRIALTVLIFLCLLMAYGYLPGRLCIKVTETEIPFENLPEALDGLKIIHISDLHLDSFSGNTRAIIRLVRKINSLQADLVFDTGDFITVEHTEFGRFDTILAHITARYGKYAILGNHDIGTYIEYVNDSIINLTIDSVSTKISSSGYHVLESNNVTVTIGPAELAIAGAQTRGRHPRIIHPDPSVALAGTEDADLRILLSHDPAHWDNITSQHPAADLTLSGHTHALQFGITAGKLKWSPAKYIHPYWWGLYNKDGQYLYVNRGFGTLGLPLRIGMRPELAVLILKAK